MAIEVLNVNFKKGFVASEESLKLLLKFCIETKNLEQHMKLMEVIKICCSQEVVDNLCTAFPFPN
jgi:hypothetical protein